MSDRNENIRIRLEMKQEQRAVETMVRESFWNVYRPGCLEHYVLHQLRKDAAFVPELDLVMCLIRQGEDGQQEKLIGQTMYMRAEICADDGRKIPIMTMGPICIKTKGVWKDLIGCLFGKSCRVGMWCRLLRRKY